MRKYVFIVLILFSFLNKNVAQDGIIAIARYGQNEPPKFRYNDSLTEFSGGFGAFKSLFLKEFKMPVKGLVGKKAPDGMVGFTVNLVGKIVDIEIIDSVTTEIDAEVVRVLTDISEFHPQVQPLKFAIQYNVFPDWFRDYVDQQEAAQKQRQQAMRADSLVKNTKLADLEKYIDPNRSYFSGDVWVGFSTMNDPLSKYLKQGVAFGGDLNFIKKKWMGGVNIRFGSTRVKQEFDNKEAYWAKDTSVGVFGIGLMCGYKLRDEEKLAFTPFVGIGFCNISLPTVEDEIPIDGSNISSFAPTFGVFVDYKFRVKANYSWFATNLNTSTIRLRLAVNPVNFKSGRRGSIVDLGIGFGFYQRALKL